MDTLIIEEALIERGFKEFFQCYHGKAFSKSIDNGYTVEVGLYMDMIEVSTSKCGKDFMKFSDCKTIKGLDLIMETLTASNANRDSILHFRSMRH
jgi:hypothetical protein